MLHLGIKFMLKHTKTKHILLEKKMLEYYKNLSSSHMIDGFLKLELHARHANIYIYIYILGERTLGRCGGGGGGWRSRDIFKIRATKKVKRIRYLHGTDGCGYSLPTEYLWGQLEVSTTQQVPRRNIVKIN